MTSRPLITKVGFHEVEVTPRTVWTILALETVRRPGRPWRGHAGRSGSRATGGGGSAGAAAPRPSAARHARGALDWHGAGAGRRRYRVRPRHGAPGHRGPAPGAAARSVAYRHASAAASPPTRTSIAARPTGAPDGFARRARQAVARGFEVIKIAPFDEVRDVLPASPDFASRLGAGLARIAAVRQAIGPERRLRVDCHWRFDPRRCCLDDRRRGRAPSRLDRVPHSRRAPRPSSSSPASGNAPMPWASALPASSMASGSRPSHPMPRPAPMTSRCRTRNMLAASRRCWRSARRSTGTASRSPHNPSGPIAHAASLHLSAALAGFERLELQFDESPLFAELIGGAPPDFAAPVCALPAAARARRRHRCPAARRTRVASWTAEGA